MSASLKAPARMSVEEFLVWSIPGDERWQLVDGEPQAMAPPNRTHGTLQAEFARVIGNHLRATSSPCTVVTEAGIIPHVLATINFRVPDLAVTCTGYDTEEAAISNPILAIEILSPSNEPATLTNVWAYTTIPSMREILIVQSQFIGAHLLRRNADGTWPPSPQMIAQGDLTLESIGLTTNLADLYRSTRLAR